MQTKINVTHNNREYVATYDGFDGAPDAAPQPIGFGATETEAVENLKIDAEDMGQGHLDMKHTVLHETCYICGHLTEREMTTNFDLGYHGQEIYPICGGCFDSIQETVDGFISSDQDLCDSCGNHNFVFNLDGCVKTCRGCLTKQLVRERHDETKWTDGEPVKVDADGIIEYAADLDKGLSDILGFDVSELPDVTALEPEVI